MHDFHDKKRCFDDHNIIPYMLFQRFNHYSIILPEYKSFLNSKDCLVN